jgi:hypothetical protein
MSIYMCYQFVFTAMMMMIMMLMIIAIVYREGLGAIEGLRAEIICMVCEERQHQEALTGKKEEEHVMKLSKLDERIRRVLTAKGGDMLIHLYLSPSMIIIYEHHTHHL